MSGNGTAINSQPTVTPAAWSKFLADNKIIPLSLITINDLPHFQELTKQKVMLRNPYIKSRNGLTNRQSAGGTKESLYQRVSIGGLPIQDNGMQIVTGRMKATDLLATLSLFEVANYVEVEEGSGAKKRKVELYHRGSADNAAPGFVEINDFRASMASVPDDTWVLFYLWVNPDNNGWLRFNLVIASWEQAKALKQPAVDLGLFEMNKIPTINIEAHSFQF